ncbi:hypothetical protein BJY52DRAFT_1225448 [Lactarius psammicola]|nr:hypothetical protein BJY52DRAFT_1225448 [Lactarius psammicola]
MVVSPFHTVAEGRYPRVVGSRVIISNDVLLSISCVARGSSVTVLCDRIIDDRRHFQKFIYMQYMSSGDSLVAHILQPYTQNKQVDGEKPDCPNRGATNEFIVARDTCGNAAVGPVFPWRDGSPLGDRAVNATLFSAEDRALIPDTISILISYARATRYHIRVQEHDVVTEWTVPQAIERATDDAGLSGTE